MYKLGIRPAYTHVDGSKSHLPFLVSRYLGHCFIRENDSCGCFFVVYNGLVVDIMIVDHSDCSGRVHSELERAKRRGGPDTQFTGN